MTLYKVQWANKMPLRISNTVFGVTAITAIVALGVYVYTAKPKQVVPDSDVESEGSDSESIHNEEKESAL